MATKSPEIFNHDCIRCFRSSRAYNEGVLVSLTHSQCLLEQQCMLPQTSWTADTRMRRKLWSLLLWTTSKPQRITDVAHHMKNTFTVAAFADGCTFNFWSWCRVAGGRGSGLYGWIASCRMEHSSIWDFHLHFCPHQQQAVSDKRC